MRSTSASTDDLLSEGQRHFRRGDYEAAEVAARQILRTSPDHISAALLAAQSAFELEDADRACDYISAIPMGEECTTAFFAFAADLCHLHVCRFSKAESLYLAWLQKTPDDVQALEGIAKLYAVCGRRFDAIPYILKLTQLGHASDLLVVLARESGAISDPVPLRKAAAAEPDAAAPLLGLARHADSVHQLAEAIRLARQAVQLQPDLMVAHAELGKYLWQQHSAEELQAWETALPPLSHGNAEIQRIRGLLLVEQGRRVEALEAFLSSAQTAPDSRETNFQIAQLLFAAGDAPAAKLFVKRMDQIQTLQEMQDRVIFSGHKASEENLMDLVEAYEAAGRIIEAYGWAQLSLHTYPNSGPLSRLRSQLAQRSAHLPLQLVQGDLDLAFSAAIGKYRAALPDQLPARVATAETKSPPLGQVSFVEHSDDVGLSFRFINGSDQEIRVACLNTPAVVSGRLIWITILIQTSC
ncbi:MAG: hypothetical protein WKF77_07330 [Planctomycetaceae bacterium]